jgi:hypothetical protein
MGHRFILSALAACFTLFACEIALRVWPPASLRPPQSEDLRALVRADPVLGWSNRPNANGTLAFPKEFQHTVVINRRGLRDSDHSYSTTTVPFRILCLGDSFTFGSGVSSTESYPAALARILGPPYEVINAGTPGWSTLQELLWLESEGLRYGPSVVLLTSFLYRRQRLTASHSPGSRISSDCLP